MANPLDLYPHNEIAFHKIIESLSNDDITGILHATGTGKTNIALALASYFKDKKIIFVTRYNSIIDHVTNLKDIIKKEYKVDLSNISFMTYSSLVNMSRDELAKMDVDILITDEFHHIGAPVWENRIETLIGTHPHLKVIGMSAYSIRDRGTPNERDMALPGGDEIFSDRICSVYTLVDAILDGVLPFPRYKTVLIILEDFINEIERKLDSKYHKVGEKYTELVSKLNYFRQKLNLQKGLDELLKRNIKIGDKLIYFCPPGCDLKETNIDNIMYELRLKLISLGYNEEDFVFYKTTSKDEENGKLNREAFYNDNDLMGNKVEKKLRIMFAINQYNEGVHVPNITGVILGRGTKSDIVFYEQIGRALAVGNKDKESIRELQKCSYEELKELCCQKDIKVNDVMSKNDLISLISAPLIIDLAGNFTYIRDLMTDLRNESRKRGILGTNNHHFETIENFLTEVIGEDIFEILSSINEELSPNTFDEIFKLASEFYRYYGHLNIPRDFKTNDGVNYNQFGYSLGEWLAHIRHMKNKGELSIEKQEKLESIGIIWRVTKSFDEVYELACDYYKSYQNLNIVSTYKTEDGYNLGLWIVNQRRKKKLGLLTEEQISKLERIGMVWQIIQTFKESYELLKKYFDYYGNIDLIENFKTLDGINYDERGFNLSKWLDYQRTCYHNGKLSEEKIILLERLHINWGPKKEEIVKLTWDEAYKLASNYYKHYHNLKVKRDFKTNDGVNPSKKGFNLGRWISRQLVNKKKNKLSPEQIKLLDEIGIVWTVYETYKTWDEAYLLAVKYYQEYRNLMVPVGYRTSDGYDLHSFLYQNRKKREDNQLTEDQINKLDKIGMIWHVNNNYAQIKEIMKNNGINPRKYSSSVKFLSVLEFSIKLKFIQDNNLPIIENGKLNRVFTISSQDFKLLYNISLEELIDEEKTRRKK